SVLQAPDGPQSLELLQPQVPARRQCGPASFPVHWPSPVQGPQSPVPRSQNWLGEAKVLQSVPPSLQGGMQEPAAPVVFAQRSSCGAQSTLVSQPQKPASGTPE